MSTAKRDRLKRVVQPSDGDPKRERAAEGMKANAPTARRDYTGCICQRCGTRYRVDIIIPNRLWNRIRPTGKPKGAGLLCGPCIMTQIEGLGKFASFTMKETP